MIEASRILVAAAPTRLRRVLQVLCEGLGHRVHAAADGQEAWLALTSFRPDLAVLDAALPPPGGLPLVAAVRARIDLRDIPLVVIAADDTPESRVQALSAGARDCLPRIFVPEVLQLRVAHLLEATRTSRRVSRLPGLTGSDGQPGAAPGQCGRA